MVEKADLIRLAITKKKQPRLSCHVYIAWSKAAVSAFVYFRKRTQRMGHHEHSWLCSVSEQRQCFIVNRRLEHPAFMLHAFP